MPPPRDSPRSTPASQQRAAGQTIAELINLIRALGGREVAFGHRLQDGTELWTGVPVHWWAKARGPDGRWRAACVLSGSHHAAAVEVLGRVAEQLRAETGGGLG